MRFSLHLKLSRLVVALCFRSLFSDAFSFTNNNYNRRLVSRPKPTTTTTKTKATPWLVHIRPADDRWRLHAIPETEEKDTRLDENNNYDDDGDGDDNDAARLWSLTLANLSTRKRNVNPGTEDDNYDIDDVDDDDDDEPGVLCDFLLELGACAAYLVDADRGTDLEEPIYGEPLDASFFDQLDREYDNAGDTTDHTKSLLSPPTGPTMEALYPDGSVPSQHRFRHRLDANFHNLSQSLSQPLTELSDRTYTQSRLGGAGTARLESHCGGSQ